MYFFLDWFHPNYDNLEYILRQDIDNVNYNLNDK